MGQGRKIKKQKPMINLFAIVLLSCYPPLIVHTVVVIVGLRVRPVLTRTHNFMEKDSVLQP